MKARAHIDDELTRLIAVLERSFERSGVFYIVILSGGHQHEQAENLLTRHLNHRHISTVSFRFDQSTTPFRDFIKFFRRMKTEGRRQVLVAWCLEHLDERTLLELLRGLNVSRGRLVAQEGQISIPIVLLVNENYYREYISLQARDLLDCLSPPFYLSPENVNTLEHGD